MKSIKDKIRLQSVIDNDRMTFTADIVDLIIKDLSVALSDYFRLTEKPQIEIIKQDNGFSITVKAKADDLRSLKKVI